MKCPMMNHFRILVIALMCVSCASTNRARTLGSMLAAGAASGAIGAATTPANESPAGHALLWGGLAAAVGAVVGLYLFDEQSKSSDLARENEGMRKTLDAMQGGAGASAELLYQNNSPFSKDVPVEYQSLIKPGQWSIYKLDQWTMQGENTLIHQDKMIKLLPPGLNPNTETKEKKETPNE
jgi:hypothetical protein